MNCMASENGPYQKTEDRIIQNRRQNYVAEYDIQRKELKEKSTNKQAS